MRRGIIKLIKEKLVDIEFDDIIAGHGKDIYDVADKIFDVEKTVKEYSRDKFLSAIDLIRDKLVSSNDTSDALDKIDAISKMDYDFIYQHGWSDSAKEVFAPFYSGETSSPLMEYVQSNGHYNVSFTGVCNSSNIDLNFGIIDSDTFDFIDGADGVALAENSSDLSDFIIEIGGDAVDSVEAGVTFGLSFLASRGVRWGVKKAFQSTHDEKKNEIQELSRKISPKMKLLSCIKNNICIEGAYPIYQSYKAR